MAAAFFEDIYEGGLIVPSRLAGRLRITQSRLASLARVHRSTMATRPDTSRTQARLSEIAHIIVRAVELAGDDGRAVIWFKFQPLSYYGKTAEELVAVGRADAVRAALDEIDHGICR